MLCVLPDGLLNYSIFLLNSSESYICKASMSLITSVTSETGEFFLGFCCELPAVLLVAAALNAA